jgi:hypothetical protein
LKKYYSETETLNKIQKYCYLMANTALINNRYDIDSTINIPYIRFDSWKKDIKFDEVYINNIDLGTINETVDRHLPQINNHIIYLEQQILFWINAFC